LEEQNTIIKRKKYIEKKIRLFKPTHLVSSKISWVCSLSNAYCISFKAVLSKPYRCNYGPYVYI